MFPLAQKSIDPAECGAPARSLFRTFAVILLAPTVGAGLGAVLIYGVLLPLLGVVGSERIMALGRHLDEGLSDRPTAICLGSSVFKEGVDASIVEEHAPPGWHVENLAVNGCDITEIQILLPMALDARPAAVVLNVRCRDLGPPSDMSLSKAYSFNAAGFPDHWPANWTREDLPCLSDEVYGALTASKLSAWLQFRNTPIDYLNNRLRFALRKGLRWPDPDDWVAPYEMQITLDGWRLDRHLQTMLEERLELLPDHGEEGPKDIRTALRQVRDRGIPLIIAMSPMHPRLHQPMAEYNAELRSLCQEMADTAEDGKVIVLDAIESLGAEYFADGMHLNAAGRAQYSRMIGERLPPVSVSGEGS